MRRSEECPGGYAPRIVAMVGVLLVCASVLSWTRFFSIPVSVSPTRVAVDQGRSYLLSFEPQPIYVTVFLDRGAAWLSEDGHRLGPPKNSYEWVREKGEGSYYVHEGRAAYFSSSDNSDPRANGRAYVLHLPVTLPFLLFLAGATLCLLRTEPLSRVVARFCLRYPWSGDNSPLRDRPMCELDGVRGWAILMIFNVHFFAIHAEAGYHLGSLPVLQELARVMHAGMVGVTVFLQLSGFLIYYVIMQKRYTVFSFLRRRFLRIMGLAFLFNAYATSNVSLGSFIDNLTFLNLFQSKLINVPTWPIVYIVYFYILASVWFIALRRVRIAQSWPMLACVAAAMVLCSWFGLRFPPIAQMSRMVDFLCGVALAKAFLDEGVREKVARVARHLFVPGVAAFFFLRWLWGTHAGTIAGSKGYDLLYFCSLDVAVALLLAAVIFSRGWWTRLFRLRPLRFVGIISYSVLFAHVPIGLALGKLVPVSGLQTLLASYVVALGASLIASVVVYSIFEHSRWPLPAFSGRIRDAAPWDGRTDQFARTT